MLSTRFSRLINGLRASRLLSTSTIPRFTPAFRAFSTNNQDQTPKTTYTFDADKIKGNTSDERGILMMAFTCTVCDTKQAKTFSRHSYEKGVVLLRCEGCEKLHLIADNMEWFKDGGTNIEKIMAEKGEQVQTNIIEDGSIELIMKTDLEEKEEVKLL